MTRAAHDPFDLLHHVPVPEPDPEAMRAAVAAGRRRFLAVAPHDTWQVRPAPGRAGWRWGGWRLWLLPAGLGLTALVLLLFQPAPPPADPGYPAAVANAPQVAEDPAPADSGARPMSLGARPETPGSLLAPGVLGDIPAPLEDTVYELDGLQLALRVADSRATLVLIDGDDEYPLLSRTFAQGAAMEPLDAFRHPGPPDLLLLRTHIGTRAQWDAFEMRAGVPVLSAPLSRRIHDAADRAEVLARLAGQD